MRYRAKGCSSAISDIESFLMIWTMYGKTWINMEKKKHECTKGTLVSSDRSSYSDDVLLHNRPSTGQDHSFSDGWQKIPIGLSIKQMRDDWPAYTNPTWRDGLDFLPLFGFHAFRRCCFWLRLLRHHTWRWKHRFQPRYFPMIRNICNLLTS